MNLTIDTKEMPLDNDMMTFVRVQDKDSRATLTVRFDKSTGPEVVQLMAVHANIDQVVEMLKAVKEYRDEA